MNKIIEWKYVPVEPTQQMWEGLARDIIMWMRMHRKHDGDSLYRHLNLIGTKVPEWLREEIADTDHVPPKGTVAVAIYKAMLEKAPEPGYKMNNFRIIRVELLNELLEFFGQDFLVSSAWTFTGNRQQEILTELREIMSKPPSLIITGG